MEERSFAVSLRLQDGYRFDVDFEQPGVPALTMDEPAPIGEGTGPNAVRVLGAAIGNCLGASLLFCLRRARVEVGDLYVAVSGTLVRNERGRLRVGEVQVSLHPEVAPADVERLGPCLKVFEDFCIVTQSLRDGLDVKVAVDAGVAAG